MDAQQWAADVLCQIASIDGMVHVMLWHIINGEAHPTSAAVGAMLDDAELALEELSNALHHVRLVRPVRKGEGLNGALQT